MTDAGPSAPECLSCRGAFTVAELLARISGYAREVDAFTASCPHCGQGLEFQVRAGTVVLGYTYWAGAMHFEGMVDLSARGLRRTGPRDAPVLEHDGVAYRLPGGDGRA